MASQAVNEEDDRLMQCKLRMVMYFVYRFWNKYGTAESCLYILPYRFVLEYIFSSFSSNHNPPALPFFQMNSCAVTEFFMPCWISCHVTPEMKASDTMFSAAHLTLVPSKAGTQTLCRSREAMVSLTSIMLFFYRGYCDTRYTDLYISEDTKYCIQFISSC